MDNSMLLNYGFYFLIYGFLGWVVEVVYTGIGKKKFVNRGFLFSSFLPIYAFGAVFLIFTLSDYKNNIFLLYLIAVIATTFLEYVASVFLQYAFNVKWWDYSKNKFNIQGRVCLRNSLLFGILGLILILEIQPPIQKFVESLNYEFKAIVVNLGLICLIIDLYFTLRKLNKLEVRNMNNMSGGEEKTQEAELPDLIDGHYTNNYISNFGLNILLAISVLTGIITMFFINIVYGMIIILIFFIILYSTFKKTKTKIKKK